MKNNFISRLLILATIMVTLYSCRTDQLSEQETYNNTSQFKLTSKTIPLSLSKHKAILGTELQKAQTNLQKSTINAFGKTIDYVNGISIDTDNVIYIENGQNYHTYTFRIIRDNADENSPIENLVLSPLTDGTYRELLVTYNLSPQEKNNLLLGNVVDTKGKVNVTEVTKGTFNSGGQLAKSQSCGWVEEQVWVPCYSGEHTGVEGILDCDWAEHGGYPPTMYTTVHYRCTSMDDGSGTGAGDNPTNGNDGPPYGPGGGNGGGEYDGQGGGYTPTEPCNGTGVLTGPQQPNTGFGDTGSGMDTGVGEGNCSGIPTEPNVGYTDPTPCETLNQNSQIPQFQSKLDSLKQRILATNPVHDTLESQMTVEKSSNGQLKYHMSSTTLTGNGTIGVTGEGSDFDIADAHNHPVNTIPVFSHGDIIEFYDTYNFVKPSRKKVYTAYLVCFNGTTYALRMDDTGALASLLTGLDLSTATGKQEAYNRVDKIFKDHGKDEKPYDQTRAEKLFMNVINDPLIGGGNGIQIYRRDGTSWGKLNMDSNGNITKENCP